MKDARTYYDDFSTTYDRARLKGGTYHAHLDDLEAAAVRRWCRGERVLEVGCGTGQIMTRVRRFAPRAVGIDLSGGMLREAKARGLAVAQASATALPFHDRSFDVVFSFKVLPHIEALDTALAEVERVLDEGGVALLEFYNPMSLRGLWKKIRWWTVPVGAASHDRQVYTSYHSPAEARAAVGGMLEVCGAHGIVILTPHSAAHRAPIAGAALRWLERRLDRSPLARWAGFYVVVARKRPAAAARARSGAGAGSSGAGAGRSGAAPESA